MGIEYMYLSVALVVVAVFTTIIIYHHWSYLCKEISWRHVVLFPLIFALSPLAALVYVGYLILSIPLLLCEMLKGKGW